MTTDISPNTQIYRVYIKTSPQAVWDAITDPQWQVRYGYRVASEYDLRAGGTFLTRPSEEMKQFGVLDPMIDGEVLECDPPHRLVQTWRPHFSPEIVAEGAKRLTWEIAEVDEGVTQLTVIHELDGAPLTAAMVESPFAKEGAGGWNWILNDLKTLLEAGSSMHLS